MTSSHQRTSWRRWFVWVLGGLLVTYFLLSNMMMFWPPDWVERRTQRRKLHERVESAAGWAAVQRDCDALVAQHRDAGIHWSKWMTNPPIPPALAALDPRDVYYLPPELVRGVSNEPQVPVVRMKIFGVHSTGGRSTPYFGLEVVVGPDFETHRPLPGGGVDGNCHHHYRRVTDRIYEVY